MMELENGSITRNLSMISQSNIENSLMVAVRVTRNFIFPIFCSVAVICCLTICFTILKTGFERASKFYIFLLAVADIFQSFGLIR